MRESVRKKEKDEGKEKDRGENGRDRQDDFFASRSRTLSLIGEKVRRTREREESRRGERKVHDLFTRMIRLH